MPRKILVFTLFFWSLQGTFAQQPFSKNYQTSEGLPSNYIYSVFQDSKGYIWVSSDVGVSRFDGQSFVHYNSSHGMPDNEVFALCEDQAGRIWFATLNGKPGFYYKGVLYNQNNLDLLKRCDLKGLAFKIFEQDDGRMVYCGAYKTILIDMERQEIEERPTENGVVVAWQNPGNEIGAAAHYFGFIKPGGFSPIAPMPVLTQTIQAITSGDTLIISSDRSLYFLDRYTGRVLRVFTNLEEGNQYIFLKKIDNKLWTGTRHGALMLDYPSLKKEKTYLSGRSVSSIMKDREGGLWFSTFEEGIFYVPDPDIVHYSITDGLLHKRVICLSRDPQQRLWIGSEGSAYSIFDGKSIQSKVIFQKNVTNKNIRNIRHLDDGTTLVIGKAGTLVIRDGIERLMVHRASDVNVDYKGDYWAGLNGLFEIPKKLALKKMLPAGSVSNIPDSNPLYGMPTISRLKGLKVEKIEFDDHHSAWVGTHNGLYVIDSNGTEKRALAYSIQDMEFDKMDKKLWVLCESKGLFAFQNGRATDSISISNQFGEVICRDLCRDVENNLWIGTASGLFRVQGLPGKLQLTNFWGVLGLGWDKINAVEVIDNQVYIGKDDGLLSVPKSLLLQSPTSPPALIKSVRINNKIQNLGANNSLTMNYGQGSLNIEFEGLSYREPQYIRYRYRLEGLDTLWHETANEALEFATLRPGKYTFEVRTVNGAGELGAQAARLQIQVNPPFWMRLWFYVLLGAVLLVAIIGYIKWRENRLRKKYEVEKALMESSREKAELQKKNADRKMLALRLQMNPHFIFNALNTIKGYYGQDKVVEANAFIGKFARLLRLNLDYSDAMIPLDQEMELLKIYLQLSQIRYPDKINFQINVPPGMNPMEIMIPSMLLQPFVENAVIHGVAPKKGVGDITVNFQLSGDEIIATIRDTGVGRALSAQSKLRDPHKPLATQITLERLQLLRGKATDIPLIIRDLYEKDKPSGTEVVLHIPFQNNHPNHDQRHHH
ncbi:MAG: histidine kinase [Phycisphaerae bacterium]|nr:histidine kinase [Saprospiraceae bacterium]